MRSTKDKFLDVKPGALVSLETVSPALHSIIGVILERHEDLSEYQRDYPYLELEGKPGFSIFWYTTGTKTHWTEEAIFEEIGIGTFVVL